MRGILAKHLVCSARCGPAFRRQFVIELPKLWCGAGDHAFLIEVALSDLGVCVRFFGKTSFVAINQCAEAWARLIIADDALPFEVTS